MRRVIYERFHGLRWVSLDTNVDVPRCHSRRKAPLRSTAITDYSQDLDSDSSVESIIEDAYGKVASRLGLRSVTVLDGRQPSIAKEEETLLPQVLGNWKKGRVARYPTVQRATRSAIRGSRVDTEPAFAAKAQRSANRRLSRIFNPRVWSQLQQLHPTQKQKTVKDRAPQKTQITSVTRRKNYGRWYLPIKQWQPALLSALSQ